MRFEIDQGLLDRYAGTSFAAVAADGCGNIDNCDALDQMISQATETCKQRLKETPLEGLPFVQTWRETYRSMGASPSKRSSIESLYFTIGADSSFPRILPLVDLYNSISVTTGLPMAGYDLNGIAGAAIRLRIAQKGEEFCPLGLRQIEKTKNGEVVYSDTVNVICRYWNYRDSDLTKLSQDTARAVFIVDGGPGADLSCVKSAADLLRRRLLALGASPLGSILVHQDIPVASVELA